VTDLEHPEIKKMALTDSMIENVQISKLPKAVASGRTAGQRAISRWATGLILACAVIAVPCGGNVPLAQDAKKIPSIAEPMYLSAYASVIVGQADNAVRPLRHLSTADPMMADVHNALALALFTADREEHALAFAHAERAVELAPDVPQFVVTHVFTDSRQWMIEANGTARLTRAAALRLSTASESLLEMRSNARTLGKILATLEETGENPDFPFVLPDYAKLLAEPRLAFTRPAEKAFAQAQKVIAEQLAEMRKELTAE